MGDDEPQEGTLDTSAANGKDPFLVECSMIYFFPFFRKANRVYSQFPFFSFVSFISTEQPFNPAAAMLLTGFQAELLHRPPAPPCRGLQNVWRPVRTQRLLVSHLAALAPRCMPISLRAALHRQLREPHACFRDVSATATTRRTNNRQRTPRARPTPGPQTSLATPA